MGALSSYFRAQLRLFSYGRNLSMDAGGNLPKEDGYLPLGRRGSVVACATYMRKIADSIPCWAKLCSDFVLLGRALCPHVNSLDPGVSGYLVGQ